jgi:hypothetical protein
MPKLGLSRLHFILLLCCTILLSGYISKPVWGFFAHKRINRLAALTLPPKMMVFYKKHLDYITEHATDADARRYLVKGEGPRHFLDLDHFGTFPFANLPRNASDAEIYYTQVFGITSIGDTVQVLGYPTFHCTLKPNGRIDSIQVSSSLRQISLLDINQYRSLYYEQIAPKIREDITLLHTDSINTALKSLGLRSDWASIFVAPESYGQHGKLPWNLQNFYDRLKQALVQRNAEQILKYSADIGHYIGDAHVPLHTVSNYNGQKTGQDGIHGFWESRIPELFADEEYDYLVGSPDYIANMDSFMWSIVLESHRHADTILSVERMLRKTFASSEQMCNDVRSGKQILTQCRNYARAYQNAMDGLVEQRMRDAIHNLSSVWYSAWVDAGQPDLSTITDWSPSEAEKEAWKELQNSVQTGKMLGRAEN